MVCRSRVQPSLFGEERRSDTKERRKSSLSDHTSAGNKIAKGIGFILNAYGTNNVEIERVANRKIRTQRKQA